MKFETIIQMQNEWFVVVVKDQVEYYTIVSTFSLLFFVIFFRNTENIFRRFISTYFVRNQ